MTARPPITVRQMHCSLKVRHASARMAQRKADQIKAEQGKKLFVYRCPFCKDWHLTKIRPRRPDPRLDDFQVVG